MKKWLVRGGIALVVLAVAGLLLRNLLVRKGMEAAVTAATGFPLEVDSFSLGLTDSRVEAGGMRLRNPSGFEDPRCIEIPRLVADMELASLFGSRPHAEEIVLDLKEVVVVRNAAGETNLDRLKALGGGGGGGGGEAAPAKEFQCDRLELGIGKVVFLDYTRAVDGKPRRDEWDLAIKEEFRDVTGAGQIVKIVVLRVLQRTPIKLVGATVDSLVGGLGEVVGGAGKVVGGAVETLGEGVKGVGGALDGIFGGGKK
jgi:hypothetical protein